MAGQVRPPCPNVAYLGKMWRRRSSARRSIQIHETATKENCNIVDSPNILNITTMHKAIFAAINLAWHMASR